MLLFQLLQINEAEGAVETLVENGEQITTVKESLWDIIFASESLWIMIPLFILSIMAVYIFFERFFAIQKAAREDDSFMNNIKENIIDGKIDNALTQCKTMATPVARMIEKGIRRIGRPLNDINVAIENVGKLEISKLEKNLPALATVAGAAPMIGFLGTVVGMVKAFFHMANEGNNIEIGTLAGGIYMALITTVAGLIVGIIAYLAYNVLVAKVEKVVNNLEAKSTEFMDLLNEPAVN